MAEVVGCCQLPLWFAYGSPSENFTPCSVGKHATVWEMPPWIKRNKERNKKNKWKCGQGREWSTNFCPQGLTCHAFCCWRNKRVVKPRETVKSITPALKLTKLTKSRFIVYSAWQFFSLIVDPPPHASCITLRVFHILAWSPFLFFCRFLSPASSPPGKPSVQLTR